MEKSDNSAKKLRDHLFSQMERLNDPKCNLEIELKKANALAKVGTVIVNAAKQEIDMVKLMNSQKQPKGKGAKQIDLKVVNEKKQIGNG